MICLYLGSMKSNKSDKLFDIIDKAVFRKKKCCFVRPAVDSRQFLSRTNKNIQLQYDIKVTDDLAKIFDTLLEYDIICIDEAQFFNDKLGFVCHNLALQNKEIYITALNGTSEMEAWTTVNYLIPYVDKIERLSGVCEECGSNESTFTFYKETKTNQIAVGDEEYSILCRKCYEKLSIEKMINSAQNL